MIKNNQKIRFNINKFEYKYNFDFFNVKFDILLKMYIKVRVS